MINLNVCMLAKLKTDHGINIIYKCNNQDKTFKKWFFKELDVMKLFIASGMFEGSKV